ncbi:hypothetical protein F4804DRAFT_306105 [Jackrogersella minutella]|nr:hypothetical protein F4804DRAFT_306105 [Jackrogersella minutella]
MGWIHNAPDNVPTKGLMIVAVSSVLTTLSLCFVCLRGYVRCRLVHALGLDDWIIFATWPLACGFTIIAAIQTTWGLGIKNTEDMPKQNIDPFGYLQYAASPLYILSVLGFKLSLILSYLRFFPKGMYRYVVMGVLVSCTLSTLSCLIVQLDLCQPISKQWNNTITGGKCIDMIPFFNASSALSLIFDFAIMILPFPILARIKIPTRKKIVLLGLFALGFFITIIQIIRIQSMKVLVDPLKSGRIVLWSAVEINLGVIVACVPVLSPLFSQNTRPNKDTHESSRDDLIGLNATKRSHRVTKQRIPSEDELFDPENNDSDRTRNINCQEYVIPARNNQIIKETEIIVINEAAPPHIAYCYTGLDNI